MKWGGTEFKWGAGNTGPSAGDGHASHTVVDNNID